MRSQGVPEDVIDYAKRPQRESSAGVYDYQWSSFVQFCKSKQYNPLSSSPSEIAKYLLSVFKKGLAPATVKVHRAAISSVLKHLHINISHNALIGDIVSRFSLDRPRAKMTRYLISYSSLCSSAATGLIEVSPSSILHTRRPSSCH